MTVTRGTATRLPIRDAHPARVRGGVWEAACHTASKGIAAPTIIADDAYRRGWVAPRHSAFVPSAW